MRSDLEAHLELVLVTLALLEDKPQRWTGVAGAEDQKESSCQRRKYFRWRGLALDKSGLLLAVRADRFATDTFPCLVSSSKCSNVLRNLFRAGGYLQVWDYKEGRLLSTVDRSCSSP